MVLGGYIDDSGEGDLFTLSCLVADSPAWVFLGFEWERCLAKKNASLSIAGRKPIRRYHATDCSNRRNDFEGWTTSDDQIPFVKKLLSILEQYRMDVVAYTINLKELAQFVPLSRHNPRRFAYVMLLHYIMLGIQHGSLEKNRDAIIGLIHDRGDYDSVLLDAFNILINDPSFAARKRFTTIAPMSSEQCISLQPADLMAYENYKESERHLSDRNMRRSLDWIMTRGQVGGFLHGFNEETLVKFNDHLNGLPREARELFLAAARIPIQQEDDE